MNDFDFKLAHVIWRLGIEDKELCQRICPFGWHELNGRSPFPKPLISGIAPENKDKSDNEWENLVGIRVQPPRVCCVGREQLNCQSGECWRQSKRNGPWERWSVDSKQDFHTPKRLVVHYHACQAEQLRHETVLPEGPRPILLGRFGPKHLPVRSEEPKFTNHARN